jgi:Host cell surface-exposed lipoprotein
MPRGAVLVRDDRKTQEHHMKRFLAVIIVVVAALSLVGPAQAATAGQRNALSKAEDYLSFTAFSKSGLADQLKFEGFSRAEARWAVNHVRVSWRRQAVKKAKSYLSLTSFSRQGLIEQLEFDGFTHSQAAYGVKKAYH